MSQNGAETIDELKPGLRRRLEFIDFRLFWDGRINRSDLREHFKISAQQASTDLEKFAEFAPQSMAYDQHAKSFVRTQTYEPVFVAGQAHRYLLQLQALKLGWLDKNHTWFGAVPDIEVVELRRRPVSDELVMLLTTAINERRQIKVKYWTMSGKPATERVLAPHSLAYVAGRWHIRAHDAGNGDFRDFNLGRLENVELSGHSTVDPSFDFEWKSIGRLRLRPNPELPPEEQEAVRREFAFEGEEIEKPCRLALLFYLRSEYHLADDGIDKRKRHLVLLNNDELEELRLSARRMSVMALQGGVEPQ
jgi:hypothetical protein